MSSCSWLGACWSLVVEVEVEVEVSGLTEYQAAGGCSNGGAGPNELEGRKHNLLELGKENKNKNKNV